MKYFNIAIVFFLVFPASAAIKKADPGRNVAGLLAHRLSQAKKYSDLPTVFNMRREDRDLFTKDLLSQKKWQKEFKFSRAGSVITFLNEPVTIFDFSQVSQKKLLINGQVLLLGKNQGNDYRNNLLRLQKLLAPPKSAWQQWALPSAVAFQGPVAVEIAAFVENADEAVQDLEHAYAGNNPTALIVANYKFDMGLASREAYASNTPFGSKPIYMFAVNCSLEGPRKWEDKEYDSSGEEYPAKRDVRAEDDKLYFDELSSECCSTNYASDTCTTEGCPTVNCEQETRKARADIASQFKESTDDGMFIRAIDK